MNQIIPPSSWPPYCPSPCPPGPGTPPPGCQCGGHGPCTCGCGGGAPQWDYWGHQLRSCWNEISQLKCLIKEIIAESGGPIYTGPIQGVVDGSNAAPGMVGEYVVLQGQMNYTGGQTTSGTISVGVLQPGDWNLTCWLGVSTVIGVTAFNLAPVPTGMSNGMYGIAWTAASSQIDTLIGQSARGNFSVPTLLPFVVTVDQATTAGLPSGVAVMGVEARRMR